MLEIAGGIIIAVIVLWLLAQVVMFFENANSNPAFNNAYKQAKEELLREWQEQNKDVVINRKGKFQKYLREHQVERANQILNR